MLLVNLSCAPQEKIGILFIHVGEHEDYTFGGLQFYNVLFDVFPPGFYVGGLLEGNTCYTHIHYANEVEATICGVEEGTPIDALCNEYTGTYPVHSLLLHGPDGDETFEDNCYSPASLPFLLLSSHSSIDPVTGEEIIGPHIDDPSGIGIGIADQAEIGGFKNMASHYRLPNYKILNRMQSLQWWYGNDAPGYPPDIPELTNIKDRLEELLPEYNFVFRHGWEFYMENVDHYFNPSHNPDSTETAIDELIKEEGVHKIVVLHTYPGFSNFSQYGHEWYDENGQGISSVPGKTFKACVEDITDEVGPTTQQGLNAYLTNKPWDKHGEHTFPSIKYLVEKTDPTTEVLFASAYGEFEEFEWAVLDMLSYTIDKYSIPQTASLKVILASHGYYGGYMMAQECDSYYQMTDEFANRVLARIKDNFSWTDKFEVVHAPNEFSEGNAYDPPSQDKPFGDAWSAGEHIDMGINGQYVNELGELIDNGIDNFNYIMVIPFYFETESSDTIYGMREPLGNNVFSMGSYSRDETDKDGTEYDAGDLDEENFTRKVYDATGWPSIPEGHSEAIYKGSSTNPTTIIVCGAFLSIGNGPVRTNLTEAAVKAVIKEIQ